MAFSSSVLPSDPSFFSSLSSDTICIFISDSATKEISRDTFPVLYQFQLTYCRFPFIISLGRKDGLSPHETEQDPEESHHDFDNAVAEAVDDPEDTAQQEDEQLDVVQGLEFGDAGLDGRGL